MKIHISLLIIIFCLYGCYIGESENGIPYIGLDWNSNELDKRLSYKQANRCWKREREIAALKLESKLSDFIDSDIYNKCLHSKGEYSFEDDEIYK
ncbi:MULTISPECIES: hypothetical protein [Pasteurellaceae]|uniref:hypothetical protein n=1 Tax=Pasteurellaceae TaxID=712 RepID=UPI0021F7E85B|nr:hypothetical protein [Avibacterium paragallinarum]UXN33964.1 hypothetical protein N8E86_07690 [Avibacterium paragallinarum]